MTEPTIPERAEEDTDRAWGDQTGGDSDGENDDRLESERPPHYDR